MRQGQIDLPDIVPEIYNVQEKSGGRTEYSITVSDQLRALGQQLTDLPLRYASIVLAKPGDKNQDFHLDSDSGQRAIIYLTDVDTNSGPIEFKDGPVLGPAGTYALYGANEMHRGSKSNTDRYALALAFDDSLKPITTIGAPQSCNELACDPGFVKKNDLPSSPPYTNETCCTSSASTTFPTSLVILTFLAFFFLIFYFM